MTTVRPLKGLAMVSLAELHPSPANPRERLTDIEDLAVSIREHGLIQPIIAQKIPGKNGLQIVAGHRRHAAAHQLGLAEVPVVVRRDMLPDEELLMMLVENGQRAGLDPIEEARALQKLHNAGISTTDIARKVGRSKQWVTGRLSLLTLPPEDQEEVRAGHYSLSHAHGILRNERKQQRLRANPVARAVGRPKGAKTKPYFGDTHPLAATARARCSCKSKPKVGGVACGECWEVVISDAARQRLDEESNSRGRCALCDVVHDPDANPLGEAS